ncbi:MAG: CBS domain-containing protein [Pseudomonadota bacterium]|nr:CBS domain-containing protein [Pseudomonadota bacterium]
MIVRSHMTPHPITLRVDSDFRNALRVMQEHAIHHLPVLDADDRVLGIVAERDLLLAATADPGAPTGVAHLMHRDVLTVRDDAPITHAATLMARHSVGGLPVIDARQRVVGIITETHIFRAFVGVLEARTARASDGLPGASQAPVAEPPMPVARRALSSVAIPARVRQPTKRRVPAAK